MASFRLRFHPGFIKELETAIAYYNERSLRVGSQFKQATKKQLSLINKNPHTRSVRYDDVRFARIEKFPYAMHYSIDNDSNSIWVFALLSDHQDPDMHWGKRV